MSSLKVLENSCRACLKETLESFFEMNKQCYFSSNNQNFGEIFYFCTRLKVLVNEDFPQRICMMCARDLQKTYEFLERVLTSNRKLIDFKGRFNPNSQDILTEDDSGKDPLENATDNDDSLDNAKKPGAAEQSEEYSSSYHADNTCEGFPVNDTLISPLANDDDKNDNDFFMSVESQIFPEGRIKCEICRKAYFTNEGLQAHMDIHLPKRKLISKNSLDAGKYSKKMKDFKVVISNDETPNDHNIKLVNDRRKAKKPKPKKMFPCEVCGKQMISASKLRYHMVMHTGEKDFLCTMCPKAYSTIYALKHHVRAHTGERPYECKFCGDRFLRPTTLKSHMRRHTGERPYGCDICGKRFIQHSSMATHIKLNHMDKTISCRYCDKKYARQTDLNTHLLSHSGDKPFACQICPSRFTRQSNLNKHINQHHGNVNPGDKKIKNNTINQTVNVEMDANQNKDYTKVFVLEEPSCSSNLMCDK